MASPGDRARGMSAYLRVGRADLLARRGQTALTALAIFAAATALVVTLALRAGLDDPFADAQDATRGAHVAAIGSDLGALAHLPGVTASDQRPFVDGTTSLNGRSVDVGLEQQPAPGAPVDRIKLTQGRRAAQPGEAVIERSFADHVGLRTGDTFRLTAGGRSVNLTVTGIAVTTEQASFPNWGPALAWGARADVATLDPGTPHMRLGVRLADPEAVGAFQAAAQKALPRQRLGFIDWHGVRDTITDQARTNTIIIGVNTLLALIVVGFTLATVISGRVLAQRREIGLLKAVGLTPRGVVALLVGEYLALALAAGILGLIAGTLIAPALLEPMSSLLATPTPSALQPGPLALSLVLLLLAVALFTAVPALRAGRLNTVDALALGRAAGSGGTSKAARLAAALHLPATVRLGVKDAFAARTRAVLTVGALGLMVVTVVAALSMEATYGKVINDPALRAKPWDVRVEAGDLGEASTLRLVREQPGVDRTTTITGFPLQASDGTEIQARALGDGYERFPYAVPDGRMFAKPGEAIAGRGALDALHAKVGDTITLTSAGTPVRLKLVGRHVEPDDDGKVVIFPRATLPPSMNIGRSDVIAGFAPGTDGARLVRGLQRAAGNRISAELVSDEVRSERADVRPIVYGSTALLVAVGLVNLLTTLLLVTRERRRDFGILKAVGLTPRGVLAVVNSGGAVLGLIATVAGIPAGIAIFRALMAAMSPSEGADIVGTPSALALVLVVPFVLLVTAAASSFPARRAAATSASVVLRAE